ncbi:hypothetical protein E4U53_000705, partial [Claviceps sorghi]
SSSSFSGTATNAAAKSVSRASAPSTAAIASRNCPMIWPCPRLKAPEQWKPCRTEGMRRWRRRVGRRARLGPMC